MTPEQREKVALLAAQFVEDTRDVMGLTDMIEATINRKLELIRKRQKLFERMEEDWYDARSNTR